MNETALTDRQLKILEAVEEYDNMIPEFGKAKSVKEITKVDRQLKELKEKISDLIYYPDKIELFQPIEIPIPQGYRIKPGIIVPLVKCGE